MAIKFGIFARFSNGELVTNVTKEIRPNGEFSPNFVDRSSPVDLTYESPEETLIRRETAIAGANQALESGDLSAKKEQEIRDILAEVTSSDAETSSTEQPTQEISPQEIPHEGGLIPFEGGGDNGSCPEPDTSEAQGESNAIPFEVFESPMPPEPSSQPCAPSESESSSQLY